MSLFEGLKEAAGGALSNLERSAQALRDAPAAMQRAVLNNPRVIAITDSIISSAEQWMRSAKKEAQWYQRAIAQEWVVAGAVFRTAENIGRWVDVARRSSTIVNEAAHVAERVGRVSQKVGDGVIGTFTGAAHLVEGTGEAIGTSIARMQTEWFWAQYERVVESTSSGIEIGVHWYAAAVEWTSRMNEYTADQWSDGLASGAGMIVGGVLPIGGVSRLWQVEKLSGVKGFLNTEVNVGKAVKAVGEKMAAATVNVLGGDASALKTQERLIAEAQQILAQQERALVQARERMQEAQERLKQTAEHQIETVREMNILKDALAKDPTNTVLEAAVKEAEKTAGQAGRAVRSAEQALRSSEGVVAHAGEAVWHAARGVHLAETAGAHHTGQPTEEQVDANTPDAANDATFPESARQSIPVQDAANDAIGIQATGTHGAPSHGPTLRAGPGLGESVIFERNGEVLTGNISDLMPDGRPVVSWRGVDPVTGKEGTFSKPMNPKDVHSANDPDFRLPDEPPARTAESLPSKPTVKLPDGTELRPLGGDGWVHSWHTPDGKFFRHVYDDGLPPELQARYTRELRAQEKVATVDAPRTPEQLMRSLENCELGSSMTLVTESGSRYTFQKISSAQFRLTHSTGATAEKIVGRDGHLTITQDGKAHFDNGGLTTSRVHRTEVGADRWELADRMARAEANSDVLRREVLENAAITDPAERARKANEILAKLKLWTLTPDQLAVVNRVHERISRGVYANGIGDLRAMTREMDNAVPRISREQQRALIEHGICGNWPGSPAVKFTIDNMSAGSLDFRQMRLWNEFSRLPQKLSEYTREQWTSLRAKLGDGKFGELRDYIDAAQSQRKTLERALSDIGVSTSDDDLARLIMRRGRGSSEYTGLNNSRLLPEERAMLDRIIDPNTQTIRLTSLQANTPSLVSEAHRLVPTIRAQMIDIMNQLRAPLSSELAAIPRINTALLPR